ncbi:hypothetical protein [Caenispirillum bisanense]|uniref:ArsR family transcriptional regulator n=1 Tax=Caenispirillum bisanense TaxID=414052 RepID=A0A286GYR1_9PROT|nr:hypothetical protein [Caenispirillum bisanense]SOE00653.1 hypothetical protein SAMN05421508_11383 [Caenispirillum bisanense]
MTEILERIAQHHRLVILRCLTERPREEITRLLIVWTLATLPEGIGNLAILQDLVEGRGHPVTRDQVATAAGWLADQGLAVADLGAAVPGVALTAAGADVALGRRQVPGVMPLPSSAWLQDAMRRVHIAASMEDIDAATSWLRQHGLVDGTAAAWWPVLPDAADVAAGRKVVEGVKRPSLGASALTAAARLAGDRLRGV